MSRSRGRLSALTVLTAVVVACSACAPTPPPPTDPAESTASGARPGVGAIPVAQKDPDLVALLPQALSAAGTITVATSASDAPDESTDSGGVTIVGADVDLGTAIAQKLGLRAEFRNVRFDQLLTDVAGDKATLAMSSLTVDAARTAEVTMITYFSSGTSVAVRAGNPDHLDPTDLCGRRVGVQSATLEVDDLNARNTACVQAGKPAIGVVTLPTQVEVSLALYRGRIAAMLADAAAVSYAVKTGGGTVQALGSPYNVAPYGIAVRKGQDGLAKAVQGAVQQLIADGTYHTILDKWGVTDGAVATSQVVG